MGLSEKTVKVLKSSVPVLESCGLEITGRMYRKMMTENPELKGQFNMSHLAHVVDNNLGPDSSFQAISLAQAVLAYAANCDNLGALGPAVERMAEKHVSFCVSSATFKCNTSSSPSRPTCNFRSLPPPPQVTAEQYDIVGKNLLWSIKEQLGDNATDEVLTVLYTVYVDTKLAPSGFFASVCLLSAKGD